MSERPRVAADGTARSNCRVYSWRGLPSTSAVGPDSTRTPSRITRTRSAIRETTARSWEDEQQRRPASRRCARRSKDLRLHRHVERGGRLVGDEQVGLPGGSGRNQRPLPQPARELVRILVGAHGGVGEADEFQAGQDPVADLVTGHQTMRPRPRRPPGGWCATGRANSRRPAGRARRDGRGACASRIRTTYARRGR